MGIQYSLVSAAKPGAKAVESQKKTKKQRKTGEWAQDCSTCHDAVCWMPQQLGRSLGFISLDLGIGSNHLRKSTLEHSKKAYLELKQNNWPANFCNIE